MQQKVAQLLFALQFQCSHRKDG